MQKDPKGPTTKHAARFNIMTLPPLVWLQADLSLSHYSLDFLRCVTVQGRATRDCLMRMYRPVKLSEPWRLTGLGPKTRSSIVCSRLY
jgi:hypothetical protein